MTACPHGMPTPGSCVDCMDEGNLPPRPRPVRAGWPFTAEYDGPCGLEGCPRGAVSAGDLIVKMSDEMYRHVKPCEKTR